MTETSKKIIQIKADLAAGKYELFADLLADLLRAPEVVKYAIAKKLAKPTAKEVSQNNLAIWIEKKGITNETEASDLVAKLNNCKTNIANCDFYQDKDLLKGRIMEIIGLFKITDHNLVEKVLLLKGRKAPKKDASSAPHSQDTPTTPDTTPTEPVPELTVAQKVAKVFEDLRSGKYKVGKIGQLGTDLQNATGISYSHIATMEHPDNIPLSKSLKNGISGVFSASRTSSLSSIDLIRKYIDKAGKHWKLSEEQCEKIIEVKLESLKLTGRNNVTAADINASRQIRLSEYPDSRER